MMEIRIEDFAVENLKSSLDVLVGRVDAHDMSQQSAKDSILRHFAALFESRGAWEIAGEIDFLLKKDREF